MFYVTLSADSQANLNWHQLKGNEKFLKQKVRKTLFYLWTYSWLTKCWMLSDGKPQATTLPIIFMTSELKWRQVRVSQRKRIKFSVKFFGNYLASNRLANFWKFLIEYQIQIDQKCTYNRFNLQKSKLFENTSFVSCAFKWGHTKRPIDHSIHFANLYFFLFVNGRVFVI